MPRLPSRTVTATRTATMTLRACTRCVASHQNAKMDIAQTVFSCREEDSVTVTRTRRQPDAAHARLKPSRRRTRPSRHSVVDIDHTPRPWFCNECVGVVHAVPGKLNLERNQDRAHHVKKDPQRRRHVSRYGCVHSWRRNSASSEEAKQCHAPEDCVPERGCRIFKADGGQPAQIDLYEAVEEHRRHVGTVDEQHMYAWAPLPFTRSEDVQRLIPGASGDCRAMEFLMRRSRCLGNRTARRRRRSPLSQRQRKDGSHRRA